MRLYSQAMADLTVGYEELSQRGSKNPCVQSRIKLINVARVMDENTLLVNILPEVFRGGWSLSQRSSGERQGTPWTGRQSITETNETNSHTRSHTLTPALSKCSSFLKTKIKFTIAIIVLLILTEAFQQSQFHFCVSVYSVYLFIKFD